MTRARLDSGVNAGADGKFGRRAVLFLEANPFASRLHVLGPMVQGAVASGQKVFVCGPRRVPGTDFTEFCQALPSDIAYTAVETREHVTARSRITSYRILRLLMAAKELLAGHEKPTLVFTAVDDYFGKLPWLSLVVRWLFPRTRIIVIRYRVADLIPSKSISLRQMQKKILLRILDKLVHPETAMFDERVPLQPNLHVLPDPWSGPFGNSSRKDARRHLDWADEVETILLVGGQDERKGFDVAVTALKRLHTERAVRVVLVGRVSRHLQAQLEQLVQTFGDSFTHVSEYISDEDLAIYFAASSVVLLPYHTAFTSTSGVLVRAAASSTPVVASEHGLVGWRTREHSLGMTFVYPDAKGLCRAIVEVLDSSFDPSGGLEFANACSERMLALSLEGLLHD